MSITSSKGLTPNTKPLDEMTIKELKAVIKMLMNDGHIDADIKIPTKKSDILAIAQSYDPDSPIEASRAVKTPAGSSAVDVASSPEDVGSSPVEDADSETVTPKEWRDVMGAASLTTVRIKNEDGNIIWLYQNAQYALATKRLRTRLRKVHFTSITALPKDEHDGAQGKVITVQLSS